MNVTISIPRPKHPAETEELRKVRMAAEQAEREGRFSDAVQYRKIYSALRHAETRIRHAPRPVNDWTL